MHAEHFDQMKANRMDFMIAIVWPQIEARLRKGMTPAEIAIELANAGYWGITTSKIGVPDIHFIWQKVIQSTKR
jgi:hypothetical protein